MRVLTHIESLVSFVLIMVALVLGLLQILLREAFHVGLVWGNGILVMLTVWAALIAASVGVERGAHISLDLLTDRLRGRTKRLVQMVTVALTLAFVLAILYYSVQYELFVAATGIDSISTYIPQWIEFLGVPVAMLLMAIHLGRQLLRLGRER